MTRATKYVGAIAALVLVAGFFLLVARPEAPRAGITNQVGYLQQLVSWFTNTVYFGTNQQSVLTAAGVLGIGTTSPSTLGDAVIDGTGTTTLMVGSSSATSGSCLQMENSAGVATKAYISGTSWVVAAGTCK